MFGVVFFADSFCRMVRTVLLLIAFVSVACFSSVSTTELATSCQRGVGCTQVVNPPCVIRYVRGPSFSMVSPQK